MVGEGVLLRKAQQALLDPNLAESLMEISRDYRVLITILDNMQNASYTMQNAWDDFNKILNNHAFGDDSCNLEGYIRDRLPGCGYWKIFDMENASISPSTYALLRKCPPTSVETERFFSLLGKLLQKDRNFNMENVEKYVSVLYNSNCKSQLFIFLKSTF